MLTAIILQECIFLSHNQGMKQQVLSTIVILRISLLPLSYRTHRKNSKKEIHNSLFLVQEIFPSTIQVNNLRLLQARLSIPTEQVFTLAHVTNEGEEYEEI